MEKKRMPPPKQTHTVFPAARWALSAGMSVSGGLEVNAKMKEVLDMPPSSTGPEMHVLDGAHTNQIQTRPPRTTMRAQKESVSAGQ